MAVLRSNKQSTHFMSQIANIDPEQSSNATFLQCVWLPMALVHGSIVGHN
jgi:hypothetical protein